MHNLTSIQTQGLTLTVRDGDFGRWDRGIVAEVAREYCWGDVDWAQVRYAMDVGGHIGSWTLRAAQHAPGARIIAVEPHPENYVLLAINTHDQLERLFAVHGAVYYGEAALNPAAENSGGHVMTAGGSIRVETYTIEQLMSQYGFPQLDVLKLDCEGSEHNIFARMEDSTLDCTRWIVGEHHCTAEAFLQQHSARLDARFAIRMIPHPNADVHDLGMFFMENRAWQPTASNS